MGSAIVELIPFMITAALVPAFAIVVLVLLQGENGLAKATAFVAGITVTRLVQGVLFGLVLPGSHSAEESNDPHTVVAALLLVIGILMLVNGARKLLTEEDADAPPPKWISAVSAMSPLRALLVGAAWLAISAKMWVFTLGAIGVIKDANTGLAGGTIAFLVFVLGAELLLIAPIAASAVWPAHAAVALERVSVWLERYNRSIVVAVSVIFGLYFLLKGLSILT